MKRVCSLLLSVLVMATIASPVFAHPGHDVPGNGIAAGLLHPLLGWDHLLAMLTVGLLSVQIGGRATWLVPASFVGCMIAGGIGGMLGWGMPAVEFGIALSVLLLGLAVALDKRLPIAVPLAFAGLFGLVHGQAHGLEMPHVDSPVLYAVGFVMATISLHVAGVLFGGQALKSLRGARRLRLSGAAVAVAGCLLLLAV